MKPLRIVEGPVVPLDRVNVDTDAIIPKQYLKSVERSGFGDNLFDDWRYLDPGRPGDDHSRRRPNPDFVLNRPERSGARILLARANFGCGSSREHAVWALLDYGIACVIAPSFSDIFAGNAAKNGLAAITPPAKVVDELFRRAADGACAMRVDIEACRIAHGDDEWPFEMDDFRRRCLLEGLDEIALSLRRADEIRAFEARRRKAAPWLFGWQSDQQ